MPDDQSSPAPVESGRIVLVCLDGTSNEPETGQTNVVRLYNMSVKDEHQLVYYDPGVGTMGARSATTRLGKTLTRVGGLVLGHGIQDNIEEAYRFLMQTYQRGDRICIVGFSRGAYTSVALAGMLRTVGLLNAGAENLIPYAMKLYAQHGPAEPTHEQDVAFFKLRDEFNKDFGNPDFPNRFAKQVHFLGLWDTVKSVGWFNWRAQLQQAHWPFTRKLSNVSNGRLALAIDENRRPYDEYRFDAGTVAQAQGRMRELWFAGVHSDVGGLFPDDHRLADISLQWMADEASALGLRLDPDRYKEVLGVSPGEPLPDDYALGRIHHNSIGWFVIGAGWHHRQILATDHVHPSVRRRVELTAGTAEPYTLHIPVQ